MVSSRRGIGFGIASYTLWGFFPIYWKFLKGVTALEILSHRFLWAFVFYLGIYLLPGALPRGRWRRVDGRVLALSALAVVCLAINWGVYIYGVNSNRVIETSLAYFLNPLLTVAVGVVFFKDPFTWPLRIAITLAAVGVLILSSLAPEFPWIAISLALSFCVYGVVKKIIGVDARLGSLIEGAIGFLPALAFAFYFRGQSTFTLTSAQWALLVGAGAVTGLPLFLFSLAALELPVSLMGMLQFIAPTLQFLCGVLIYGEELGTVRCWAFILIWAGIGFYLSDRMARLGSAYRARRREAASGPSRE